MFEGFITDVVWCYCSQSQWRKACSASQQEPRLVHRQSHRRWTSGRWCTSSRCPRNRPRRPGERRSCSSAAQCRTLQRYVLAKCIPACVRVVMVTCFDPCCGVILSWTLESKKHRHCFQPLTLHTLLMVPEGQNITLEGITTHSNTRPTQPPKPAKSGEKMSLFVAQHTAARGFWSKSLGFFSFGVVGCHPECPWNIAEMCCLTRK